MTPVGIRANELRPGVSRSLSPAVLWPLLSLQNPYPSIAAEPPSSVRLTLDTLIGKVFFGFCKTC